jgi:SAM-dependent methyltransferase
MNGRGARAAYRVGVNVRRLALRARGRNMSIRGLLSRMIRFLFELLPESSRRSIVLRRAEMQGLGQLKRNQALLTMRLAKLEEDEAPPSRKKPEEVEDDRFPPQVRSRLCTQSQLGEPWFQAWHRAMDEPPLAHRKNWEFAYVAEVLDALEMLQPGRRALGFGVGREPLVSAFAGRGVEVLATDLAPSAREAKGWTRSGQHAFDVEGLQRPTVCDPETFRRLVTWRAVDMRAIPGDVRDFDFCWSICSLEHLGTLSDGLRFIEQSLATLRPGGIAVHTTEFNLSSNEETVEAGPSVIYRERDVRDLKERLEANGHQVASFDFTRGDGLLDQYVDVPPYSEEPVLRFLFASYTLTSIAIVIRARAS